MIHADGGARGNPGPAGIGFVIKDSSGREIYQEGKYIGEATNNAAEYTAVIEALKYLVKDFKNRREVNEIKFFLDSLLVVNQLNGVYKIKNAKLRNLIIKVRQLEKEIGKNIYYLHVPRERNKEADALVNQSLDERF